MNGTIRVGSLFGIPFYVHPSWFLVLGLVTLSYSGGLAAQFPQLGAVLPFVMGLATALLLFASVLAHELGHSLVAIRQGIGVKSITLFLFGGLANLEKESKTPGGAFWIAIAGPLVSFLIFGLLTLIHTGLSLSGPLGVILSLVATINLILGLFNLIPGLPLDGGNILKAAVWKVTGNPYKGVRAASFVGQGFGWFAIATGLFPLLASGSFSGVWNILIGSFLLQNAGRSAQFARVQEKLTGLTAADAVIPNSPIVSGHLSLREFANQYIIGKTEWKQFLVVDEFGQLVGAIAVDDMKQVSTNLWPHTLVNQLTHPMETTTLIPAEQSLWDVVTFLEQKQLTQLPVVQANGVLVGLIEKSSIIQLLQQEAQGKTAPAKSV